MGIFMILKGSVQMEKVKDRFNIMLHRKLHPYLQIKQVN